MKFVLLNGPPRCGKDTAVSYLVPYLNFAHLKFSAPIKRALAGLINVTVREIEDTKDVPNKLLFHPERLHTQGCDTNRSALISLSEDWAKQLYGNDFFGRVLWHEARQRHESLFLVSDCGFIEEVNRLVSYAGRQNCILVRIHRPNCDFSGDSRSYLPDTICSSFDVTNDGTIHDIAMRVLHVIKREFQVELIKEPTWIKDDSLG